MLKHINNIKPFVKEKGFDECLELLRALADQTRQEILIVLINEKEICANDIAKHFKLSRPTISHHLNLMKRSKILYSRKEGKEIYYSINKVYIKELITSFLENLDKCC